MKQTKFFDQKYEQRAFWFKYIAKYDFYFKKDIFWLFTQNLPPSSRKRVLDLGVTDKEINYFHKLYPYPNRVTAAGLAEQNQFIKKYFPQIKYIQISEKSPYPFKDNQFDVVHSSAVIEHVGSRGRQEKFLSEIIRIGRSGVITTPNRWFPVELHTYLPFLHWLPTKTYRKIYRFLGMKIYSQEENLNLLTFEDLDQMAKKLKIKNYWIVKKYSFGFVSNFLFFWDKTKTSNG